MKIFLSLLLSVSAAFGASEFDLRKGIDLTGATNVTASQLNQLVDAGLISATNKGGVIRRSGNGGGYWPSVTDNPRYTNFLWLDTFTSPPIAKTYTPPGDGYGNWTNVGAALAIGAGAINSLQLAADSVQTVHITNNAVTSPKINPGAIDNTHLQSGSVRNINIADGTIQSGKIATGAILATNIAAAQLLPIHFGAGSVTSNALAAPGVATTNIFDNAVTSNKIAALSIMNTHIGFEVVNGTTNIAKSSIAGSRLATNVFYGIPVCWAVVTNTATPSVLKGLNVASVAGAGVGTFRLTFGALFVPTDVNYCITANAFDMNNNVFCTYTNKTTTTIDIRVTDGSGTLRGTNEVSVVIHNFL